MTLSRDQLLATLQDDWGAYPADFHRLSAPARATELKRQGYRRFADLLAHIISWWRDALKTIPRLLADPDYHPPEIDVDTFNAWAIATFRAVGEPSVVEAFDDTRQALIDLVGALPDQAFQDERIAWRLDIEIIGHLQEHELKQA